MTEHNKNLREFLLSKIKQYNRAEANLLQAILDVGEDILAELIKLNAKP